MAASAMPRIQAACLVGEVLIVGVLFLKVSVPAL
jgi:hypothetical protein